MREESTKAISRSFIDGRELSKENLRKAIEKENFFQKHQDTEHIIHEKTQEKVKKTEKNQMNLVNYLKKNDDFYNKFLKYLYK
jgi:hypothetical protein